MIAKLYHDCVPAIAVARSSPFHDFYLNVFADRSSILQDIFEYQTYREDALPMLENAEPMTMRRAWTLCFIRSIR